MSNIYTYTTYTYEGQPDHDALILMSSMQISSTLQALQWSNYSQFGSLNLGKVPFMIFSAIDVTGDRMAVRVGGEAKLERLKELKQRWDPDNFFKANPYGFINEV